MQSDYESFASNCSKCHDLARALAAPVTDNRHWDLYVAKMMRTAGSAISESERPHILRFLYWYTDQKTGRVSADSAKSSAEPAPLPAPAPRSEPAAPIKQEVTAPETAPLPAPAVPSDAQGESTL